MYIELSMIVKEDQEYFNETFNELLKYFKIV
jgi:hypothetical protein